MQEADAARDFLIDTARGAGRIALSYAGASARVWEKPDDAGPVTDADITVNDFLRERLLDAYPGFGWLSEESEDGAARQESEYVFIVDPIDGTRNFIEGGRTWAHSIALARRGEVIAGVVYLPARDMLFSAALGQGARLNGDAMLASRCDGVPGARILAARPGLDPRFWRGTAPPVERAYRPSLAYRMALVAGGRFDGMVTLRRTWEWDIAAGSLIAEEAGAAVTDRDGARLVFNAPDPRTHGIIAAAPDLHKALLDAHDALA